MDLLLVGCTGISLRTHTRIVPDTCTYIVPDIQYPLCPIYVFKKMMYSRTRTRTHIGYNTVSVSVQL